jgi:hypothetical protein
LDNADNPEQIHFGIVSQESRGNHPDLSWISNKARVVEMHYKEARGAGYARKLCMELYDGQDYFLQIDSHMRFSKSWDSKLIKMLKKAQEIDGSKKIILSQFPAPYMVLTDNSDHYLKNDKSFWDRPSWTTVESTWGGFWSGARQEIEDLSLPHKTHTLLAGYIFSTGKLVEEVPYDERISFMGEELCFAIRAYTRGWELYAPNEMVCWHFYKREEDPKIWKDNIMSRSWSEIEMYSQKVQKNVLLGIEKGVFGVGDVKRYHEYQKMIGINFAKFYKEELHDRVNLGTVSREIIFDDNFNLLEITKSGYCNNNLHVDCAKNDICMCHCHDEVLSES